MDEYLRCDVVVGLVGRWLDDDIDAEEREPFELHILVCPPCLEHTDKARRLKDALASLPGPPPPEALRALACGPRP